VDETDSAEPENRCNGEEPMDLKQVYTDFYGPSLESVAKYLPIGEAPAELLSPLLLRDLEILPFHKRRIVKWIAAMATAFERSGL